MKRLRTLLTRTEFTVLSTLFFSASYFWPFVAFSRPVRVFRFLFVVWLLQIALCLARKFLGTEEADPNDETSEQNEKGGPV